MAPIFYPSAYQWCLYPPADLVSSPPVSPACPGNDDSLQGTTEIVMTVIEITLKQVFKPAYSIRGHSRSASETMVVQVYMLTEL